MSSNPKWAPRNFEWEIHSVFFIKKNSFLVTPLFRHFRPRSWRKNRIDVAVRLSSPACSAQAGASPCRRLSRRGSAAIVGDQPPASSMAGSPAVSCGSSRWPWRRSRTPPPSLPPASPTPMIEPPGDHSFHGVLVALLLLFSFLDSIGLGSCSI